MLAIWAIRWFLVKVQPVSGLASFFAAVHIELAINTLIVCFDRVNRNDQFPGDLLIGQPGL